MLLGSHAAFADRGAPYPFAQRDRLMPDRFISSHEHRDQNTAFVILVDGPLRRALVKHFRLRDNNRVSWRNIQRLAPQLDISDYKAEHCRLPSEASFDLLRKLITVDYALLLDREDTSAEAPVILRHMHIKIERLTDNAIRELGRKLGYIERRLFERGEDHADALESKFYEYYGFSANASGRKSAAAMAAQLLAAHHERFTVFVAGQDDCRLTVLDESPTVAQYFLIRLDDADAHRLAATARDAEAADLGAYVAAHDGAGAPLVIYRLRLRRTPAAQPGHRDLLDRSLSGSWLDIAEEAVVPAPPADTPDLPFAWAQPSQH